MRSNLLVAHPFLLIAGVVLTGCGGAQSVTDAPADKGGLIGNPAPEFKLEALNGAKETISLDRLRGQVVLVDFWGTFCDPCKKSFPKLQALGDRYRADGLKVVGISEDDEDDRGKIRPFAEAYGAKFALAWDGDKAVARRYGPETMPSSFLIDRRGVVRFVHVGFHDGEEVEIDREIRELLAH
ncbi:MAG TPA: TlpA disulfide reductase family protein [Polyangiaceae bacterium]|jgi:peroxiredoxin|nr:TlpA disulfide reductase family protein [Polyangiaceae bacterium]